MKGVIQLTENVNSNGRHVVICKTTIAFVSQTKFLRALSCAISKLILVAFL
jgi:hypothetical protein